MDFARRLHCSLNDSLAGGRACRYCTQVSTRVEFQFNLVLCDDGVIHVADGGVTLLAEAEARRSEAEGRVLHLERKMADASGERERELAVAEGKVAAARGSAQRASKAMKDKQQVTRPLSDIM